jgi:hypothetical protein
VIAKKLFSTQTLQLADLISTSQIFWTHVQKILIEHAKKN